MTCPVSKSFKMPSYENTRPYSRSATSQRDDFSQHGGGSWGSYPGLHKHTLGSRRWLHSSRNRGSGHRFSCGKHSLEQRLRRDFPGLCKQRHPTVSRVQGHERDVIDLPTPLRVPQRCRDALTQNAQGSARLRCQSSESAFKAHTLEIGAFNWKSDLGSAHDPTGFDQDFAELLRRLELLIVA